jgi:carbonic anhydrase
MKFLAFLVAAAFGQLPQQSPIDLPLISTPIANNKEVSFSFGAANAVVSHKDTVIEAAWNAGVDSNLTIKGDVFKLLSLHPHYPSEHTINGKQYPFEMHFVHANETGTVAVLGVLYDIGPERNEFLDQLYKDIATLQNVGDSYTVESLNATSSLMPQLAHSNIYRYSGSLTTPPYNEGVIWQIVSDIQTMSQEQLDAYKKVICTPNSRPVQPLNGRHPELVAGMSSTSYCQ